MKRIYKLTIALTKNWLRSRSGIFFSILFPLLLLLIFGAVFGEQQVRYTLFVQNLDIDPEGEPTELSQALINALNSTGVFDLRTVPPEAAPLDYAREALGKFRSPRVLIIPRGFQEDAINGSITARVYSMLGFFKLILEQYGKYIPSEQRKNIEEGMRRLEEFNATLQHKKGTLILLVQAGDQGAAAVKGVVRNVVSVFNARLVGAGEAVKLEEEVEQARSFKAVDYYLPGYIAAFTFTNGAIGLTSIISDFRRRGVIKRLAVTPLTRAEWVVSNVLHQGILAFLLTLIMIAVGWGVFKVSVDLNPLSITLILLGALMASGVGMILGGAIRDPEAASAAGNSVAFPLMFLSGAFWPLELMPDFLQRLAEFLPLTYLARGLRNAMIYGDLEAASSDALLVALIAAAFIALGIILTKWRER